MPTDFFDDDGYIVREPSRGRLDLEMFDLLADLKIFLREKDHADLESFVSDVERTIKDSRRSNVDFIDRPQEFLKASHQDDGTRQPRPRILIEAEITSAGNLSCLAWKSFQNAAGHIAPAPEWKSSPARREEAFKRPRNEAIYLRAVEKFSHMLDCDQPHLRKRYGTAVLLALAAHGLEIERLRRDFSVFEVTRPGLSFENGRATRMTIVDNRRNFFVALSQAPAKCLEDHGIDPAQVLEIADDAKAKKVDVPGAVSRGMRKLGADITPADAKHLVEQLRNAVMHRVWNPAVGIAADPSHLVEMALEGAGIPQDYRTVTTPTASPAL